MALIKDVATVKANGVRIQFINADSQIADMQAGEDHFIEPVLGATLYQALVDAPTDPAYEKLLPKVCRALAPLAYWLDLPNIQSSITDRGTGTFTSNNIEPLHRWEYEALLNNLEAKGCFHLEKLLEFLYANASALSWTIPNAYKGIFVTGAEFNNYYTIDQPYRTFDKMRPWVRHVEEMYITPMIGEDFYASLLALTEPGDAEKKAIKLIKFAVANLVIKTACEKLPVKISPNGFLVRLGNAPDDVAPAELKASRNDIDRVYESAKTDGENYLLKLQEHLDTNAITGYTNPADASAVIVDPNCLRSGVYGF